MALRKGSRRVHLDPSAHLWRDLPQNLDKILNLPALVSALAARRECRGQGQAEPVQGQHMPRCDEVDRVGLAP